MAKTEERVQNLEVDLAEATASLSKEAEKLKDGIREKSVALIKAEERVKELEADLARAKASLSARAVEFAFNTAEILFHNGFYPGR